MKTKWAKFAIVVTAGLFASRNAYAHISFLDDGVITFSLDFQQDLNYFQADLHFNNAVGMAGTMNNVTGQSVTGVLTPFVHVGDILNISPDTLLASSIGNVTLPMHWTMDGFTFDTTKASFFYGGAAPYTGFGFASGDEVLFAGNGVNFNSPEMPQWNLLADAPFTTATLHIAVGHFGQDHLADSSSTLLLFCFAALGIVGLRYAITARHQYGGY